MVKHFYLFSKRFHLLESTDFTPFLDLINTYKPKYRLDYSSLSDTESSDGESSSGSGKTPKEPANEYVHVPRISLDFIEIIPVDEFNGNLRSNQNISVTPPPPLKPEEPVKPELPPKNTDQNSKPKPPELPPKDPTLYSTPKPPQLPPKTQNC